MISIDKISIPINKKRKLVSEGFNISAGLHAIIGRNGAGKSTFIKALIGQKKIEGNIYLNQKLIQDYDSKHISKTVSIVYTKPEIFGDNTVEDIVRLGRLPYQNAFSINNIEDDELVNDSIELLGLLPLKNQKFRLLSDGEKQMTMIARALAQDTSCVILDEPTAFLDIVNRRGVIQKLYQISQNSNKLILFSTHDIEQVNEYCSGLISIDKDYISFSEEPKEFESIIENLFK